jgi:hypothetical protein
MTPRPSGAQCSERSNSGTASATGKGVATAAADEFNAVDCDTLEPTLLCNHRALVPAIHHGRFPHKNQENSPSNAEKSIACRQTSTLKANGMSYHAK